MPFNLTTTQILQVWDDADSTRDEMQTRQDYYDGDQAILDETTDRYDGSTRNLMVTNWIKYIVNKHVGFMTAKPVEYTLKDPKAPDAGLKEFDLIDIQNTLDAVDQEHLRQCILKGYSVEVHSYDGEKIKITQYDSEDWVIMYDELDQPRVAIHRAIQPANSIYRNQFLEFEKTIYTVYDDASIRTFELISSEDSDSYLDEIDSRPHPYGRLPLVIFRVTRKRESFIGDDLISQQDAWNTTRSSNLDDLQYNVDAILKLIGYDVDAMFEADEDGVTFVEKLRKHRILPLKEGGEAEFIEKGNEKDKVAHDLDLTRSDLHMMARVADVEKIIGATGTVSGIALKLCLMPQIDQAIQFSVFFEEGLRDRIDLINRINAIRRKPILEDFNVSFTLNIPVNETEIWQYIPNLEDVMTRKTRLSLIPSIEDPEAEAKAKEIELQEEAFKLAEANEDAIINSKTVLENQPTTDESIQTE